MKSITKILSFLAATIIFVGSTTTFAYAQEHGGGQAGEHAQEGAHEATGHEGQGHDPHQAAGHEAGGHEGTTGHEGGHHGPAPINWTDISNKTQPAFIALALNFGILVAIYYALGKKGVVSALKQRRVDIGKDIDDARKMLEEAKERAKKYQADLKNADVDAETAKASLVSAGKGEVEHMLAEANEKAERMKRDADRLVEQEQKQLKQDLLVETIGRAVTKAQSILEKQATSEDHARLAQELLAELGRMPAAPRVAAMPSVRPASATGGGAA